MKIKITIIISVLSLCACNQNKQINSIRTYKVEAENTTGFDMEKISSFAGMVALETTDESIIGKIGKVFLTDSSIIVWDKQTKKIFLFDKSGKYLYHIGSRGPGPEEYVSATDVYSKTFQTLKYDGKIHNVFSYGDNLFFSFSCYPDNEMQGRYAYINFNSPNPVVYYLKIKHSNELAVQPLPDILGLSKGKLIYQIIPGMHKTVLKN